jgi:site-specific recombinase XerD
MNRPEQFYNAMSVREGLGEVTIGGYRRVLTKFFRDVGTDEPKLSHIENYIAGTKKRGCSYSHIANTSVALERYMAFIKRPIKLKRPRKPKQIIKNTLTEGEVARILAATKNERERAMLAILVYSGIRNKELCSLKPEDIDFNNQYLRVIDGKGSKDRVVYISRDCVKSIIEYIGKYARRDTYLFTTLVQDKQYNGWALRKMVKVVSKRAGVKKRVYPHLFRHSLACNLLQRGANIMTIKEQLGHQDLRTTMIYAHSTPQRVQQEYNFYCPTYN